MSWHYLQEGEEASWEGSSLDGAPSALLRLLPTHGESCSQDKEMASCQRSLFGMTSEHLTGDLGEDTAMSSAPGSHAHPSVSLESEKLMSQTRTCGLKPSASFAKYDPSTSCWRTYQASLLSPTGTCTPYSETWPRAGMTVDGIAYPRQPLVPIIREIASGLLPTITAQTYGTNQGGAAGRVGKVRMSLQSMATQRGGRLSPSFVERMMNWPVGWTDLEPLAMDKYRQWYASHGECSHD